MSFFVVLRHLAVTVLVVVGSMSSALAGDTTSATADPADYQRARLVSRVRGDVPDPLAANRPCARAQ